MASSLPLGGRPRGAPSSRGRDRGRFRPQHLPHLPALLVAELAGVGGLLLLRLLLGRPAHQERRRDLAGRRQLEFEKSMIAFCDILLNRLF